MNINRKNANKLWHENYGNAKYAKDFSGHLMHIDGYGKRNYRRKINGKMIECGWNIHHILPKAKGGTSRKQNLACTNFITNDLAADKTTYKIRKKIYQVRNTSDGHTIHCLN